MERELYIGVDVSKRWLDIAYYDGITVDWKQGHIRVDNKDSGFLQIGKWLDRIGADKACVLFCMEYTGLYCQDLRLWLEREGIVYGMVSPRKMHRFEPDLGSDERALDRIKTDEMDSFRIAMYCEKHSRKIKSQPSRLPAPAYFNLKRLIAERRQYVTCSALYKGQLHDCCAYDSDGSVKRKKEEMKSLKMHVRQTGEEMLRVIAEDDTIKRNFDLLCSITGVGIVVATETIILTENFTAITNPRRYACYVGIAPGKKESGDSVRGGNHVSRKGFTQAKADLSVVSLHCINRDPNIKAYWQRKKAEGKHGGVVLNAIKFKIVLRMFAVIKRQTPFVEMDAYRR